MKSVCCIIPIKYESTRVPGKNYRNFNGKPLLYWIINCIINIENINKIVIDTDSDFIINLINELFKEKIKKITFYNRPKHLHGGHISTNKLLLNVIKELNLDYDIYIQTHVTNPLLNRNTIQTAIDLYNKNMDSYDSLFSVNKLQTRLYNNKFKELNHDRFNLIPTQELEEIYEENSCIYIFSKETLFKYESRIGIKPYLFTMSTLESVDIDWEDDFIIAEQIFKIKNT